MLEAFIGTDRNLRRQPLATGEDGSTKYSREARVQESLAADNGKDAVLLAIATGLNTR